MIIETLTEKSSKSLLTAIPLADLNIKNAIQILLVEDLRAESDLILTELKDADMHFEVEIVDSEERFKNALQQKSFDVILSPYSLRGTNGAKLFTATRNIGIESPFILLAFELSEDIAIDLLTNGIEDYVLRSTLKRLPVAIRKALYRYKTTLELRLSEARIKASEMSLRNMVRNTPIAVAMFDNQMNYLVVSDTWLVNEGKIEEEIIGKNHYDVNPDLPEHAKKVHKRCLAGETLYSDEQVLEQPDGSTKIIRWKLSPWYDVPPNIGGVVLFKEDITEQVKTKNDLKQTAKSLEDAQNIAKIGNWEWRQESKFVRLSNQMFEIYEIDPKPMTVADIRSFVHPEDLEMVKEAVANDLTENIEPVIEYRIITGKGSIKHVVSSAKQVLSTDGAPTKLIGTLQDVTDRRAIEQSLADTHQLLKELAEHIDEVFWVTDKTGGELLYMSPMYEKVYGRTLEELYDENDAWSFNIHPDDKARVENSFAKNGQLGKYNEEYRLVHPDGSVKWVKAKAYPIKDKNGNVIRLAGITQEITERKKSKERIELLSLVASGTVNGVLIQAADGTIEWANNGFSKITGYSLEEVKGKEPWSFLTGDETNTRLIEMTYEKVTKGKPFSSDNKLVSKDGVSVWVQTTFTPIVNDAGEVTKIVSIGTDISKQKELEFLQKQALKRLERDKEELLKKSKQ